MEPDFETERLRLRQFNSNDHAFILKLLNSPGWLKFIGDRNVHTEEQARLYLENGPIASYARNGFGLYMVELKATQTPIGMCGLVKRDNLDHPDLGFAFLDKYGKQGYAYEAAKATLENVSTMLKIKLLFGITSPANAASRKLLEKLDFVFKGTIDHHNEKNCLYALELDKTKLIDG